MQDEDRAVEVAHVVCRRCISKFLLIFLLLMVSPKCNSKEVDCVWAARSKGITCVVCLQLKQKCGAVWGKEKAGLSMGSSRFLDFGEGVMELLKWLVVGVEKIG